jgi:predicted dehydrogenase
MKREESGKVSRREFLKTAAMATAAASTFSLVKAESAGGTKANSKIQFGFIGCGGRGNGDAVGFMRTGECEIVAVSDYFEDRARDSQKRFRVEESRCFVGENGYKKVLDLKDVDAIIQTTPPGFRPRHFVEAVDAGKHVFMEKPVAVDTWGCRRVLEWGEKAKAKNLSVMVGMQHHHDNEYIGAHEKVAEGAIGTLVQGRAIYTFGPFHVGEKAPEPLTRDWMVRHWYCFRWLSGDYIAEQNVHCFGVLNWFIGGHPIRCAGYGGRKVRTMHGDIFDHFNLVYEYPGPVHLTYISGQVMRETPGVKRELYGTKGSYYSPGTIKSDEGEWKAEGGENQYADFVKSLKSGPILAEARRGAEATFTAILGRTAGYTGREAVWDTVWEANEKLEERAYPPIASSPTA